MITYFYFQTQHIIGLFYSSFSCYIEKTYGKTTHELNEYAILLNNCS